jgi:hypothetical protein
MIAVAAQIVHFLPQLVAVRRHLGEVLAQSKRLSIGSLRVNSSLASLVDSTASSRIPVTLLGRLRIDACIGAVRADPWRRRL